MDMKPDYAVHLFFKNTPFVHLYFEAAANSFDAGADRVDITITSDGSLQDPDLTIEIFDNGDGFGPEDFARFSELREPKDEFHKGLGRLVFLKYFFEVEVETTFKGATRSFRFSNDFKGESTSRPATEEQSGTRLTFRRFRGKRVHAYADLAPDDLKQRLLEQFYPMLLDRKRAGDSFQITIKLVNTAEEKQPRLLDSTLRLTADDLLALETKVIPAGQIDLLSPIKMHFMIDREAGRRRSITAASVDGRTIPLDLIKGHQLPAGAACVFIFESDLFDQRSDSSRQRLVFADGVSQTAVMRVLREAMAAELAEALPEIEKRNQATSERLEERYPHLAGLFHRESLGLVQEEAALDHAQAQFFAKQKAVLSATELDEETFKESVELSARSLMEYVLYRDFTVRRLADMGPRDMETKLHDLIAPRYQAFDGHNLAADRYRNNAWLFDDKFMTFRSLLSEKKMHEVLQAITTRDDHGEHEGRPDISLIFSADPNEAAAVDVVIVELKRRRVDDKEGPYAATQLLKRAQKLVDHCPNIQRVWYYGVLEIDADLARLLRSDGYSPLYSKGQVFYRERPVEKRDGTVVPSPTFLMSFDALIKDASARNHAFLNLLRGEFARQRRSADGPTESSSFADEEQT